MADRYLNLTRTQKDLLDLVTRLGGRDRIVITHNGQPRAVLVHPDRYAVLEDMRWVLRIAGNGKALRQAWEQMRNDKSRRPAIRNKRRKVRPRARQTAQRSGRA